MSQQLNGHVLTVTAGEDLAEDRLVRLNASGAAVYCDAGEEFIGKTRTNCLSGEEVGVLLPGEIGTWKLTAAGAVTALANVYTANDGKVDDVPTGTAVGKALHAATANNSKLEVLPFHASSSAVGGVVTDVLAGEDLAANRLVKFHTDGTWVYADADMIPTAITLAAVLSGAAATVRILSSASLHIGQAAEQVDVGDVVYTAADGKIKDTASKTQVGIAKTGAATDALFYFWYLPALPTP